MVQCELCGRQFKTPQGLRGHKTFFHGHRAGHNKPVELRKNSSNNSDERLEKLIQDVQSITETLADINGNLNYLQGRIVSLASHNEVRRIVSEIDRLNNQVKKHDQWFNPRGIHEAIVDLDGGPIASIEKRLRNRQSFAK